MNYRNKLLFCLCTILGGMNIAVAADETPFALVGEIIAGKNEMGLEPLVHQVPAMCHSKMSSRMIPSMVLSVLMALSTMQPISFSLHKFL
jgi:hypothetical protein